MSRPASPSSASVAEAVRKHVARQKPGEPFSVRKVLSLGPRASVDQALSRMVKSGELQRPARGVYARPKINKTLKRAVPVEPEKVVETIAKASGAKIGIHGAEAARRFGLSTQVPVRKVYTTTGRSRKVTMSTGIVTLRHVEPRRMQLAGSPAGEALAALLYLGHSGVTPAVIERIREALPEGEFERLRGATEAMPHWLATTVAGAKSATA